MRSSAGKGHGDVGAAGRLRPQEHSVRHLARGGGAPTGTRAHTHREAGVPTMKQHAVLGPYFSFTGITFWHFV